MNYLKRICVPAIVTMMLSACQSSSTPVPLESGQERQLAALIGGGNWLRENCSRSDVPDERKLQQSALAEANDKGWNVAGYSTETLTYLINDRYKKISEDTSSVSHKCTTLNSALAPFLRTIR